MEIALTDITDKTFLTLTSDEQDAHLAIGNERFAALCLKHDIDNESIANPAPYTPKQIGIYCVLLSAFEALVGTDWREVGNGPQIDTYKAKIDYINGQLERLLGQFTPKMCGYDEDSDTTNDETSSFNVRIFRG